MPHKPDLTPDPREIAKWAKRYAQSRTIPFLVQWVFIVALVMVVGGLCYFTIRAYQYRQPALVWTGIGALGVVLAALLWFSVARWGGEQIWRISQWLYGREGYAAYAGNGHGGGRPRHGYWVLAVGMGLAVYHLAGLILVVLRYMPMRYIQPFSAFYMVPFLAIMTRTQRLGFWAWVWPAAYALHAVFLMTGLIPHFPGQWQFLDIIVPVFGYGLLSIIVGHLYSRYALRRLKQLARAGLADTPDDEQPPSTDKDDSAS